MKGDGQTLPRADVTNGGDTYIQTLGGPYFFEDPGRNPEVFNIEHIAKALSHNCRFTGQVDRFISVAEHSVTVAEIVELWTGDADKALAGLLHDAAEALLGDVSSPLKAIIGEPYRRLERKAQAAIFEHYGLRLPFPEEVKAADMISMATEKRDLVLHDPNPWPCLAGVAPIPSTVKGLYPDPARDLFLETFDRLTE
jgi:hypothetical protein